MKRISSIYFLLAIFFLLYNLITLSISPIVWTDEISFASIANDFIQHHTFYTTTDLGWVNGMQTLVYGPVYFIADAVFIKLLGNNIFAARLTGLLAGFLLILLLTYNFRKNKSYLLLLLFAAILMDEFFISSMHKGRNDTLSMLFFYGSLILLAGNPLEEEGQKKKLTLLRSFLSGILFALSILTTIRMGFLVAPFAIFFLLKWKQESFKLSVLKNPLLWGITIAALYIPWIYWGFGGFNGFIAHYQYMNQHFSYFVSSWFRIPLEVFPLFLLFVLACVVGLMNASVRKNPWYLSGISIVVSYFLFVGDTGSPAHTHKNSTLPFLFISLSDSGPYSIIILPVFYIIIAMCVYYYSSFKSYFRLTIKTGVILIFVFNAGLFALKSIVLLAQADARNTHKVDEFIHSNIPSGSSVKVCGDEIYYYAICNNGNPFHIAISYQSDVVKTESYSRNNFDYDFLVISKRLEKRNPKLVHQYLANARLEKVADYEVPQSSLAATIAKKMKYNALEENYEGTIYKRIRN